MRAGSRPAGAAAPRPLSGLPIDAVLPALRAALASSRNAVLQAPPGAGKSTVVPLALLAEPWMRGRRLIMLEPRRLAARAVAQRMSAALGEPVGRTVGYRMRFETRVSQDTRIEVVTEGVLARMLEADPALEGTAIVLLDEFHERSLQADVALALALDAQATVAPDLRLLVMSATLDAHRIATLLGGAPVLAAEGRLFPVESRFVGRGAPILADPGSAPGGSARAGLESVERLVARVVIRALAEEEGDVLVFLPGAREIRRVLALLADSGLDASVRVLPLHGELAARDQDEALAPSPPGARRVVLSTNLAETSLTVDGIRTVVDSGLVRRSVFDPVTGMSRLVTRRISRASAEQRQGRAGRLAPGVCYRLWSEEAHRTLAPYALAEILETDLAALALELAAWGVRDACDLSWLDPPPPAMLASARDLLRRLGALDAEGRLTRHGKQMARLGVHPRLAHLLLAGLAAGELELASRLAALLSERDALRGAAEPRDADVRSRLERLSRTAQQAGGEDAAVRRAQRTARLLARQVRSGAEPRSLAQAGPGEARRGADPTGMLLASAYPDRIGLRRAGSEAAYLLANGRGASFSAPQALARQELIVALDLDDSERNARILLAAALEREDLERGFADRLEVARSVDWSEREQAVLAAETVSLGALVLSRKPLREVPAEASRAAMLDGVRRMGLDCLPWSRDARDLQARVELVRRIEGASGDGAGSAAASASAWRDLSDPALLATLESWLAPWLDGVTRREHLARVPLLEALLGTLSWEDRRRLDALAPAHLAVPSGSRVRIDYLDESAPSVAVRLQELFGLAETPRIAGGRIPIAFKLLSPAHRPVQITRDLASFWRGAYAQVRKDLRGRYPKHYWPDDPLAAEPTRRAKPRR